MIVSRYRLPFLARTRLTAARCYAILHLGRDSTHQHGKSEHVIPHLERQCPHHQPERHSAQMRPRLFDGPDPASQDQDGDAEGGADGKEDLVGCCELLRVLSVQAGRRRSLSFTILKETPDSLCGSLRSDQSRCSYHLRPADTPDREWSAAPQTSPHPLSLKMIWRGCRCVESDVNAHAEHMRWMRKDGVAICRIHSRSVKRARRQRK